jgi:hypothetical protein
LLALQDNPVQSCEEADRIAREHMAEVDQRIAKLVALRAELQRMVEACACGRVADCKVIETLADPSHTHGRLAATRSTNNRAARRRLRRLFVSPGSGRAARQQARAGAIMTTVVTVVSTSFTPTSFLTSNSARPFSNANCSRKPLWAPRPQQIKGVEALASKGERIAAEGTQPVQRDRGAGRKAAASPCRPR